MPDQFRTREELLSALSDAERRVAEFFESLSADELMRRVGSAWTAAEQLDHLNTSLSAVTRGFSAPRLVLRLRFGRARKPSRGFAQLRDDYRARLAAGGKAPGAFVPQQETLTHAQAEIRRQDLVARWHRVNGRLRTGLESWSEKQLEVIRLPHPLLGKITAREMAFFAIYHADHHINASRKRIPRFADEMSR